MVSQFGGLNKKLLAPENEFSDMLNMSAMQFPMVATREKRGHIRVNGNDTIDNAIGVHAKDRLLVTYLKEGDTGVVLADGLEAASVDGVRQSDGISVRGRMRTSFRFAPIRITDRGNRNPAPPGDPASGSDPCR
jgi:hypothetical protein